MLINPVFPLSLDHPEADLVSFTTAMALPAVTTQTSTSVTCSTATLNGTITALGTLNPTQHGHVWNTTQNPTTAGTKTEVGAVSAIGAFVSNITGLLPNTTYYVRSYATNDSETVYGEQVSFNTFISLPVVTTQASTFYYDKLTISLSKTHANILLAYRTIRQIF